MRTATNLLRLLRHIPCSCCIFLAFVPPETKKLLSIGGEYHDGRTFSVPFLPGKFHNPTFNAAVQYAGLAVLTDPSAEAETDRMREVYNQRRLYMIQRLQAMGLGITAPPTGAFYVFANARHVGTDSLKLAFDILEKAHVGVTPGIDFGQGGEGYLRFSYANSMENIAEGMDRLERYLKQQT